MPLRRNNANPIEIIMNVVGVARSSRILDHNNFSDSNVTPTVPTAAIIIDTQILTLKLFANNVKYAPNVRKSP